MATCYICGKPITIVDSTTTFYDPHGNVAEVHTACKDGQQTQGSFQNSPEFYTPEVVDESKRRTGYILAGVAAVALIVGAMALGAWGSR